MPIKTAAFEKRENFEDVVSEASLIAAELVSTVDDYSVKISSPLDKRFWVRIEREVDRGTLVVTDFNPGDRRIEDLAAGLLLATRAISRREIRTLVFRDLVPSGEQTSDFPVKVVHAADLVKRLGAAVAADMGVEIKMFDMQPRRGKIDGMITFV